jgi:hypothetical protein
MPYKISWKDTGVEVLFSGKFDFEVNKNANCEIYEDPRCDSINYRIWDASNVSLVLITEAEFSVLAMQDNIGSCRLPNFKLAMLAKDTETLSLFEYYANYCNARIPGWNVMVFDSMEKVRSGISS